MNWIRIDESERRDKSHITRRDKAKLMDMVLGFGWDCWYDGDNMYPWEAAEQSHWRYQIEDMLDEMS